MEDLVPKVSSTKYVTNYLKKYKYSISEGTLQLNHVLCEVVELVSKISIVFVTHTLKSTLFLILTWRGG